MYLIEDTKTVSICVSTRNDFDKRVVNGEVSSCNIGQILCVSVANNFDNQALTTFGRVFDKVITVKGAFGFSGSDCKFGVVEIRRTYRFGRVINNSLCNGGRQKVFCRYRL